jgi:hypothetical protein
MTVFEVAAFVGCHAETIRRAYWRGLLAETAINDVGLDTTGWQAEAHFASWLSLWPDNRMRSHSYLGAQYRRLRGKLGAPKAITAMAHRLARLAYRVLKCGHEYVDKGLMYDEERHRDQQVQLLKKRPPTQPSLVVKTRLFRFRNDELQSLPLVAGAIVQ